MPDQGCVYGGGTHALYPHQVRGRGEGGLSSEICPGRLRAVSPSVSPPPPATSMAASRASVMVKGSPACPAGDAVSSRQAPGSACCTSTSSCRQVGRKEAGMFISEEEGWGRKGGERANLTALVMSATRHESPGFAALVVNNEPLVMNHQA